MKKKMPKILLGALGIMLATTINAYAGQWVQNDSGWWYDYGNGTWPANSWQWIDGNNDGIAECYYFDMYGYMLANTTAPDGYTVDGNGAWTVNGVIQTRNSTGTPTDNNENEEQVSNIEAVNLTDLEPSSHRFYQKFSNKRTNQNALWSEGFSIDPNNMNGGWAEFYAGGNYTALTFTMSPEEGYDDQTNATIEIYGDDDNLLYSSDELTYKSDAENVTVDITGQDYIKIYGSTTYRLVIGSPKTKILFKNARFQ